MFHEPARAVVRDSQKSVWRRDRLLRATCPQRRTTFGNQESGTNATIKEFCSAKFHVKFPMMAKVSVKGDDKTPLYQYLTAAPNVSGEIKWNFTKFLIARNGQPIARFEPAVTPDSPQVISAIESALKP
jgi:glutathione peroxidase